MLPRSVRKLITYMEVLRTIQSLSTCKRHPCAALVMPTDFSDILAIGYNGPSRTDRNDACTGVQGSCGCIHAEVNALLKFNYHYSGKNLLLLSTVSPCRGCMSLIENVPQIVGIAYDIESRHGLAPMTVGRWTFTGRQFLHLQLTGASSFTAPFVKRIEEWLDYVKGWSEGTHPVTG